MSLIFRVSAMFFPLICAPLATAGPTVLVIVGAEGESEYGAQFTAWADRWTAAAGKASAEIVQVGRDSFDENLPDRQKLKDSIAANARESLDPLWLVLIGHGTFDGKEAKFNLRGPDVTDAELAEWLKPVKRPLAVINCASASAPFLSKLSGADRVILTATRSGTENNFARFGEHLADSIADPSSDLDKDGQTSLLEAFLAASHRTAEFYKQASRLATEHALLDDNGDKLGVSADWFEGTRATRGTKDGVPIDGIKAHQWHLVLSPSEQAMPADVRARRDALELELAMLRTTKKTMPEAEYYAKVEPLLVQLARLYADSPASKDVVPPPAPSPGNVSK